MKLKNINQIQIYSSAVPPQLHKKVQNDRVKNGDSVHFKCIAHGDKPMIFTWHINGQSMNASNANNGYLIKQSQDTASETSEFAIKQAGRKDSTNFICSVENYYGSENATFNLLVLEKPDAPEEVKIIEANNRTVVIGWTAPFDGNNPINKYILQYKLTTDNWELGTRNLTLPGHKLQSAISNLKPSANYHVRIMAGNDIGLGLPSDEIQVLMPDQAPAGPPLNVNAIATDSNSLKVSWQAPHAQLRNGIVKGYYVGYKIASSSSAYQFRMLEVPEDYAATLSLPINDLHKFTQYSVVVQAFNDGGKGPLSKQVIAVTSESIPTKPPRDIKCSVLSSQSIHLTWQPPPLASIHGMLQGFKVTYKPVTDKKNLVPEVKTLNTSTKLTLQNLEKYTNYSVQISAMTGKGDGVKSEPLFCRTFEAIPDIPSDVKVLPMSAQSVIVAWKTPTHPNGIITKYTVYIQQYGVTKEENAKNHNVGGNTTFYEIKNLKQSETYRFWVTASTMIGESAKSRIVSQSPTKAAKIAGFGASLVITQGEDVLLPCKSVGTPTPQQRWMNMDHRRTSLADGSLLIKDMAESDSDNYTCHVQNEHGQDYITYSVTVQSAPGTPFVEISLITTSSIDIQWKVEANGGSPVLGYKLYYKHDQSEWQLIDLDAATNSYHLDGLHCGTKYQLYMIAYNKLGHGKPTHVIATATKGGVRKGDVAPYATGHFADHYQAEELEMLNANHPMMGFGNMMTTVPFYPQGRTSIPPGGLSAAEFARLHGQNQGFATAPPMSDCYGGNGAYQIKGQATPQRKMDGINAPPPPPPLPIQNAVETTFTFASLPDAAAAAAKEKAQKGDKYDAPWDAKRDVE
uniref:Down syndrome cell adhesion molecule-like protein Dscam2 n=1 Tax=Strigamia maritima TaxID=126957 RepID=T1JE43_STRMM